MDQLHYLQMHILKKLLFSPALKFSELKPSEDIENNQLSFHIDQLMKDKLIDKKDNSYFLTAKGKEFANRMSTENLMIKKQAKIGCIQCCIRNINGYNEFLCYTRLKHPFYGSQGYASGKVNYGERTADSVQRELKEETNLDGTPTLFMIEHHRVYNKETKELLEDKFFFFYRFINPTGELLSNEEGKFEWIKEEDLADYFKKPFETVERLMYITEKIKDINQPLTYKEIEHYADNF